MTKEKLVSEVVSILISDVIDEREIQELIARFKAVKYKDWTSIESHMYPLIASCALFNSSVDMALSPSHKRECSYSRSFFMKYMRSTTPYSFKKIGGILHRDHSTVIQAIKSIDNLIETNKDIRYKWEKYLETLERHSQPKQTLTIADSKNDEAA